MRFTYTDDSSGVKIQASHLNLSPIPFRGRLIDRSRTPMDIDRAYDVFEFINSWYATQDNVHQGKIFDALKRAREAIEYSPSVNDQIAAIRPVIDELFILHDFESIRFHLSINPGITIPESVKDAFDHSGQQPGSRSQTYIREEYLDLIAFSTMLRVIYPLFMEFIGRNDRVVGTQYKEHFALKIIMPTKFSEHRAMKRLMEYIEGCINEKKTRQDLNIIVDGIGSEAFQDYVLATVIVKKVCCSDIRGHNAAASVVSVIWQAVRGKVDGNGRDGTAGIVAKEYRDGPGGESELSVPEGLKTSTNLSVGDVATLRVYASNGELLIRNLRPLMPANLFPDMKRLAEPALSSTEIEPCQIVLAQYTLKPVFNPRGFNQLRKVEVINLLIVAGAVLWDMGYYALAGLVTASKTNTLTNLYYKTRLSAELTAQIHQRYSAIAPTDWETNDQIRRKKPHPVVAALQLLSSQFAVYQWHLNLLPWQVERLQGNHLETEISAPSDLLNQMATMVLDITGKDSEK